MPSPGTGRAIDPNNNGSSFGCGPWRLMTKRSEYLRRRFLDAPIVPPPKPWRLAHHSPEKGIGGLAGVGFGRHPTGNVDLLLGPFSCRAAGFSTAPLAIFWSAISLWTRRGRWGPGGGGAGAAPW